MRHPKPWPATLLSLFAIMWWSVTASAQLDPLLFAKRVPPTVIIVVDTSLQMLEDGSGNFYDPGFYSTTADPLVMNAFPGINSGTTKTYRRVFRNLTHAASPGRYAAGSIVASAAVWDPAAPLTSNAPADLAFMDPTRHAIAKQGIAAAVADNAGSSYRWGLIRLRQSSPAWRVSPACDKPVQVSDGSQLLWGDAVPCAAGGLGKYGIYAPSVAAASYAQGTAPAGTVMVTPASGTSTSVLTIVNRPVGHSLGLIPAGAGDVGYNDRPIDLALADAKTAAAAAMAADTAANRSCRNTVVILITGGKDDGNPGYS
ncbi:MAG: hypothetical protein LC753_08315, partial [Acidobacteria bacterium]|nr:hypothetical protein [Acidobacteriota bacterium]